MIKVHFLDPRGGVLEEQTHEGTVFTHVTATGRGAWRKRCAGYEAWDSDRGMFWPRTFTFPKEAWGGTTYTLDFGDDWLERAAQLTARSTDWDAELGGLLSANDYSPLRSDAGSNG